MHRIVDVFVVLGAVENDVIFIRFRTPGEPRQPGLLRLFFRLDVSLNLDDYGRHTSCAFRISHLSNVTSAQLFSSIAGLKNLVALSFFLNCKSVLLSDMPVALLAFGRCPHSYDYTRLHPGLRLVVLPVMEEEMVPVPVR